MRVLSSSSYAHPTPRPHDGAMSTLLKAAIAVALLVPMTAYVVGSLVAAADEPARPDPIIVQEAPAGTDRPTLPPRKTPGDDDPGENREEREDREDREDDNSGPGSDDESDDDGPIVVRPEPDDLRDESDDDGRDVDDDDGDDDDRGRDTRDD